MIHQFTRVAAAVVLSSVASVASAATIGYALDTTGSELVVFDVSNPGNTQSVTIGSGTEAISAIDFRPINGDLLAYSDASDTYFILNPLTGSLTPASPSPAAVQTDTALHDIDWNPTIDRMRNVTQTDLNIVYNPFTGGTTQVTDLFYIPADPNVGADPSIVANAYTNSLAEQFGVAGGTTQYVLDSDLNILATLGNNAGTLVSVGGLGVDFLDDAGLDIVSGAFLGSNTGNVAYALLNTAGGLSSLYTVDLGSGVATLVGDVGGRSDLTGLAVRVPVPASLLLVAAGFVLLRLRRA